MAPVEVYRFAGVRWTRREMLGGLASIPLGGCVPNDEIPSNLPLPSGIPLIDAHCHLFNINDLPAASFTQIALLRKYQHAGSPTASERRLRAALDAIEYVLNRGVVSAKAEADLGSGNTLVEADAGRLSDEDQRAIEQHQREAEAALAELDGEQALIRCDKGAGPTPSVGSIVTWLRDLRSSRATLTRRLTEAHATSGYSAKLLCPALVDYANWLEQPLKSPLPDQVRVAGVISANPNLIPVHGYAPFDPLRRALVREGLPVIDGNWNPLVLLREALVNQGFAGVKLYPPMGFRASGNEASENTYPPHIEAVFKSSKATGAALDKSLNELWEACEELDAPILAHAANSNAGGSEYGRRADPTFWLPVASNHKNLRIMLAHFGRFRSAAAGFPIRQCSDDLPFEHTWEAAFGNFIQANPDSNLFADVSYLSELFHSKESARALARMKLYLKLDPDARHLIFGSDWVMLGIEAGYRKGGGYPHRVADFFRQAGLSPAAIDGVMYGNALRFLGLKQGTGTRTRLGRFLAAHGLPESRLPA